MLYTEYPNNPQYNHFQPLPQHRHAQPYHVQEPPHVSNKSSCQTCCGCSHHHVDQCATSQLINKLVSLQSLDFQNLNLNSYNNNNPKQQPNPQPQSPVANQAHSAAVHQHEVNINVRGVDVGNSYDTPNYNDDDDLVAARRSQVEVCMLLLLVHL